MTLQIRFQEVRSLALADAVDTLATAGGVEARGAVFTKSPVVEAILDLCGYTVDAQLENLRLLEPSFGRGGFLVPAVRRLLTSYEASGGTKARAYSVLSSAIRAVEIHRATFEDTRMELAELLRGAGFGARTTQKLLDCWLLNDDFLLSDFPGNFDFVIGNPPYVRQERIPPALLDTYKAKFVTLYDRADLYVLFYEHGLDLLKPNGCLGFICSNRWIKNKYGGPLRRKVSEEFHLKYYINLEGADAFDSEVMAYPAVTVIQRNRSSNSHVALGTKDCVAGLQSAVGHLVVAARGKRASKTRPGIAKVVNVANGSDPWLVEVPHVLAIIRKMERNLPELEDAGAKVGIGVASGADRVFIADYEGLPVEDSRKLRIAMAADCVDGEVVWGGRGIINPYLESGQLASLAEYPRFGAYLRTHSEVLKRRHTAKKQPAKWYKTIDRIYPAFTSEPKLLIPDIKGEAIVAYDDGHCYPHHNLYVVTSTDWDLRALQAVLRSSVALMFVAAYCVRMSGGFLRFQAQYLRRIRIPDRATLTSNQIRSLVSVASSTDQAHLDDVVLPLFGLDPQERDAVLDFAASSRISRKI